VSSPLLTGTVASEDGRPSWYRATPPSVLVAEVVASRWHGVAGWDRTLRVLPDGCADLIWDGDELIVVGAHPGPLRFPVVGDAHNTGLRLRPGTAGVVLGVPMVDLPLEAVRLDALAGASARRLEDRLRAADGDVATQHELLERHVADRIDTGPRAGAAPTLDRTVVEATRRLRVPTSTVDTVAAGVGLSPRELRRRFLTHVGYGPKALQRVLRFRRFVLHAGDDGASLADLAARSGYADQSHLGRECLRLSGSSPRQLVEQRRQPRPGRNVPDRSRPPRPG